MYSYCLRAERRCEMKWFEIRMVVAVVFGLLMLSGLNTPPAHADIRFGEPVAVDWDIPLIGVDLLSEGWIRFSYDGLEMYISAYDHPEGYGDCDLWVVKRTSVEDEWGPPENLGPEINSPAHDSLASLSADGLTLYFISNRPGGHGSYDLYMTTRATKDDPWGAPVNLGPPVNTSAFEADPLISADGLELYLRAWRPDGYGGADLYVSRRPTTSDPWGEPVNLGPGVNNIGDESWACLSSDGLLLLFCEHPGGPWRPGGYGAADIWMTRRTSLLDPWQDAVNAGPMVNSPAAETVPRLSLDGRTLYFWRGGVGLLAAPILPIVDFNGDGKVDMADLLRLIENWGTDNPLYDIGPYAWGDGVVDEQDLRVLMEWLMIPGPRALDVSCDVVLNWVAPSLAESQDVYFGTSLEAVSSAGRDNPQDVLVSQGQTGTMYIPQGPLDFSQTYYWRVDFVIPDLNPAICKGPILQFTTEPYAHLVTNVVASSNGISEADAGPENTVDGSGLDEADQHSVAAADMWLAKPPAEDALSIQFEFDRAYKLHEMLIWNYNSQFEPLLGFGLKDVTVEYSVDGDNWTVLGDVEVARATARPDYVANTVIDFDGIVTRFVRLTVNSGWGATGQYGLSEVRFLHIPVHARNPQPADGATDVAIDADLIWWPGRETQSHLLYFGTDADAVAAGAVPAIAQTAWTYTPEPLEFGTTYYWKVDQVDEAATYEGDLWCFTTQELEDCER